MNESLGDSREKEPGVSRRDFLKNVGKSTASVLTAAFLEHIKIPEAMAQFADRGPGLLNRYFPEGAKKFLDVLPGRGYSGSEINELVVILQDHLPDALGEFIEEYVWSAGPQEDMILRGVASSDFHTAVTNKVAKRLLFNDKTKRQKYLDAIREMMFLLQSSAELWVKDPSLGRTR